MKTRHEVPSSATSLTDPLPPDELEELQEALEDARQRGQAPDEQEADAVWGSSHLVFLIIDAHTLPQVLQGLGSDPLASLAHVVQMWQGQMSVGEGEKQVIAVIPSSARRGEGPGIPVDSGILLRTVSWLASIRAISENSVNIYVAAERGNSRSPELAPAARVVLSAARSWPQSGLYLDTRLREAISAADDDCLRSEIRFEAFGPGQDSRPTEPVGARPVWNEVTPPNRTIQPGDSQRIVPVRPGISTPVRFDPPRSLPQRSSRAGAWSRWVWGTGGAAAAVGFILLVSESGEVAPAPAITGLVISQPVLGNPGSDSLSTTLGNPQDAPLRGGSNLDIRARVPENTRVIILQQDRDGLHYIGEDPPAEQGDEGQRAMEFTVQVSGPEGPWRLVLVATAVLDAQVIEGATESASMELINQSRACPNEECRDAVWQKASEILQNALGEDKQDVTVEVQKTYRLVP